MKKKILTIIIAAIVVFTAAFTVPVMTGNSDCYAKTKTKYIKIKKTTYKKMKQTITNQSAAIESYKKTVANQKTTISKQSTTIQNQSKTIDGLNTTVKEKKQTISWLWSTLEDFGFHYNYDTHQWEGTEEEQSDPEPLDWVTLQETEDIIPVMAEQTGLTIDKVEIIETWKSWASYYVEADGSIYVITMKKGIVDVCQILN